MSGITTAVLCDDDGLVIGEYLDRLNVLRQATGLKPYEGGPFPCTGSMHALGGAIIHCSSPAHVREA